MNERSIFIEALDMTNPRERTAYLDAVCRDDAALRRRIEKLLAAHDAAGGILDRPAVSQDETGAYTPISEGAGTVIGPYKLMEQIGEGGFGLVFVAEQQQPVRRKVALKIIKPGMDTRQVIARFEAERQALALMDHPNIARVFDGGTTDGEPGSVGGRPYFVMELVRGVPITEYCDVNHLSSRERLELFTHICQAVQHAHQKGIIHRDIKPSNILVTIHDGRPLVKVIDFGVAKAIGQQLTDKTIYTQFAQMVGTPHYMSPEQAGQGALDVDTRSDIYSLGVLLYELLTGTTPFPRDRFKQAAYDEIRRIIREEEPPKPSTRISTMGKAASAISMQRKSDPRKLSQLFRGELDWIVMKCLEKDRNRRYETANGLADDIKRYLCDEPVQACPPRLGYRLRKFVHKHRAPVVVAACVFASLVVGLGVILTLYERSEGLRQQAVVARTDAEEAQKEEAARSAELREALSAKEIALNEKKFALRRSDGLRLTAESSAVLEENPGLAMLLAIEGARVGPRRAVHNNALLAALERCQEERTLRHESAVHFAAVTPDGRYLLCALQYWTGPPLNREDFAVRVWHIATGKLVRELAGHQLPIASITISPDSKRVAFTYQGRREIDFQSGARRIYTDRVVRVWDITTGKEIAILRHKDQVVSAAFSLDGTQILTASHNSVHIWDVATAKPLVELPAGESSLQAAGFLPDGKRIFTLPSGYRIEISYQDIDQRPNAVVDPAAGVIPPGIEPTDPVRGLSSGGGSSFSGGGMPQVVRIWDAAASEQLSKLRVPSLFSVESIALSPDGDRLFTANLVADRPLPVRCATIWQVPTGKMLVTFALKESVRSSGFSPDGQKVLTISPDALARVWDATNGKELAALQGHEGKIVSARFSPDCRFVVTASEDRTARLWDANSGKQVAVFRGHERALTSAVFTPDGQRVVTASVDGTARIWRVAADVSYTVALLGHEGPLTMISFSPRGGRVVTASEDKTARIWDAGTGKHVLVLKPQYEPLKQAPPWMQDQIMGAVQGATFSSDGRRLLTLSDDRIARIRFVKTSPLASRPAWEQLLKGLADLMPTKPARGTFVPAETVRPKMQEKTMADVMREMQNKKMAVAPKMQEVPKKEKADAATMPPPKKPEVEKEQTYFTPARIWDAETGKELIGLSGSQNELLSATFGPNGKQVVTAEGESFYENKFDFSGGQITQHGSGGESRSDRATVARICDSVTGKELLALPHKGAILSAVFTPDGRRLLTVGRDVGIGKQVRIWDAETGRQELSIGDQVQILWGTLSPDGGLVLTMEYLGRARIWNAQTGKELAKLDGPTDFLHRGGNQRGVAFNPFSPDSRRLALPVEAPPYANVVAIWDATTGKKITLLKGHRGGIYSAVFSADGRQVVTASADETARIWDAQTGAELYTLTGHKGAVHFATFSPDGTQVATASADGTARLWLVDPLPIALARKPRDLTVEERARYELDDGVSGVGIK